ncbi:MAG: hypothetical protein QNK05_10810 [Myxococcota bacterium]|nr:hypothetical protein [Myxococcota bacterium]
MRGRGDRQARRALALRACARIAILACLAAPTPVLAGPPAAIDSSVAHRPGWVERSFRGFAKDWLRGAARQSAPGHRVGDDFELEVRATRSSRAPFVGILRYHEERWSCSRKGRCRLEGRDRVAEIFRFQDGRWIY